MQPDDIEQRLTDLEIKASFSEDTLDRLNEIVVQQQRQIDALTQALRELQQQRSAEPPPGFRSLRDELPPHY